MPRSERNSTPPKTKWGQILIVGGVLLGGMGTLAYYRLRTPPVASISHNGEGVKPDIIVKGAPAGNGTPRTAAVRHPPREAIKQPWNPEQLTRELRDTDPAVQAQGLAKVTEWCSVDPASAAWPLQNQWGKYLLASHHYQEAAELSVGCILEVPTNADYVCGLLRLRTRALLGQGKKAEALQCAKSLYNLSPLDRADEALYLVAFCLSQAHPEDAGIYHRFQQEQQRGAMSASGSKASSPIMASIHVDPAPYDSILGGQLDDSDNQAILAYGNMALLADQPGKAREVFALLSHLEPNRQVDVTVRLMKTEDGVLGRANAYVVEQIAVANKEKPIQIKPCRMPWPMPANSTFLNVAIARVPFGLSDLERTGRLTVPAANVPFGSSTMSRAVAGLHMPGINVPLGVLPKEFATTMLVSSSEPNQLGTTQPALNLAAVPQDAPRELLKFYLNQLAPSGQATLASWAALAANRPIEIPAEMMPPIGQGHYIMSLCQDLQGRVWVGCEDEGVWCWSPTLQAADQWQHFTRKSTGGPLELDGATIDSGNFLGDDNGYALACDKQGRIWVGHLNHGVSVYDGRQWRNYSVLNGPLGERVFAIAVCPADGDVWIATSAGLTRYSEKNDTWSNYTRAEGLPSDQVRSVAFDKDGCLYVGTQCDGIAIADAKDDYKAWRVIHAPREYQDRVPLVAKGDGLPTNLINAVLVTASGSVFVATTTGLASSTDHAATFKFIRGADWEAKARGLYTPPSKEDLAAAVTQAQGATVLPEDYITCLAEEKVLVETGVPQSDNHKWELRFTGRLWLGFRQKGYVLFDPTKGEVVYDGTPEKDDNGRTPDYINAIASIGSVASTSEGKRPNTARTDVLLGVYDKGLASVPMTAIQPAPSLPFTSVATLPMAQSAVLALPAPAKPPSLAELNNMLAKLQSAATAPLVVQPTVVALADDWRTQGAWLGRYGRYWSCCAAMCSPSDYVWGAGSEPVAYVTRIGPHCTADDALRYWVQWLQTAEPRSLEMPPTYLHSRVIKGLTTWDKNRRQAEWDDHSESYPTFHEGPDIYCTLKVPEGLFYLSLYDFNKDGHAGCNRLRDYGVSIRQHTAARPLADIGDFTTQPELARSRIDNFWGGVWKRYVVRGPTTVTIKLVRNGSVCTILAAVMLDLVDEEPAPYFRTLPNWREEQAQSQQERRKLLGASPNEIAERFHPAEKEDEAVTRLITELNRQRLCNPAWWATEGRSYYAILARWLAYPKEKNSAENPIFVANLGTCYYQLNGFAAWERLQKQRGLTTAREIEKALRWDGVTSSMQGKGYQAVVSELQNRIAE